MYSKQPIIDLNNIIMSSSLPKIKTLVNNSETESQKNLKFKKLKLNTNQSTQNLRQRFNSVKTQRLNSLERYSTVEQQREYRKQKIHLNLLQRKLLSGTYDEAKETGRDLNDLKQKTDAYKIQAAQKLIQIQRIKRQTEELKRQIEICTKQQNVGQQEINKAKRKYEKQKNKTQVAVYEKSSFQHMITTRKNINITLENKSNELKSYLHKLKALIKQLDYEARQADTSMKNLLQQEKKATEQFFKQQKSREQMLSEKLVLLNKRKQQQKKREQKSKQYRKQKQQQDEELQRINFTDIYTNILANIFVRRYTDITMMNLQDEYQGMENMYNQIASYNKFDANEPQKMIERFAKLKLETIQYETKIKKLQKIQTQLQIKHKDLIRKNNNSRLTLQRPNSSQNKNEIDKGLTQHDMNIRRINEQIVKIDEVISKIRTWTEKQIKQFNGKVQESISWEDTTANFINLIKIILEEKRALESERK